MDCNTYKLLFLLTSLPRESRMLSFLLARLTIQVIKLIITPKKDIKNVLENYKSDKPGLL